MADETHQDSSKISCSMDSIDPVPGNIWRKLFSCCFRNPDIKIANMNTPVLDHRPWLVLDLDETLVHSTFVEVDHYDFKISTEEPVVDYYVKKRPFLDNFLQELSLHYELILFTSADMKYASPVIDRIDPLSLLAERYYRQDCALVNGTYVKDLRVLKKPLDNVLIIDNSPGAYSRQPDNAVPISSWMGSTNDTELRRLVPFLVSLATVSSIPSTLKGIKQRRG